MTTKLVFNSYSTSRIITTTYEWYLEKKCIIGDECNKKCGNNHYNNLPHFVTEITRFPLLHLCCKEQPWEGKRCKDINCVDDHLAGRAKFIQFNLQKSQEIPFITSQERPIAVNKSTGQIKWFLETECINGVSCHGKNNGSCPYNHYLLGHFLFDITNLPNNICSYDKPWLNKYSRCKKKKCENDHFTGRVKFVNK